ncbi:hypothetical protein EDC04DRAFT_2651423 [Pisolithus marmoratus]|nr:hypothetical protein EDC04DRAFT_2651423 [Pisolithus marmoratus]
MQLTKAFLLLTFAAYARAGQCTACGTMEYQVLTSKCNWDGQTFCSYDGGNSFCTYWNTGKYAGFYDHSNSVTGCPKSVGKTLTSCNTCKL